MAAASRDTPASPTGLASAAPRRTPSSPTLLACFDHPHVASVDGVDEAGRLVVHPGPTALAAREWLRDRRAITAGEAVTLLVPLLSALIHLERRGIDGRLDVVSPLSLDDVVLDERGMPVWGSLHAAAALPKPGIDIPATVAVAATLIDEVLASTVGGEDGARLALLGLCRRASRAETADERRPATVDELIEALVDLAVPAALATHGAARSAPAGAGSGSGRANTASRPTRSDGDSPTAPDVPGPPTTARGVVGRLAGTVRQVRPRVWLLAGGVAASVVVGTAVLGGPTADAPDAPSTSTPTTTSAGTSATTSPTASSDDSVSDLKAVTGDDPVAAATVLLRARARCLRELDAECLAGVEQPGAPGLQEDLSAIEAPDRLGDAPVDVDRASLVNRLGDAALFSATAHRAGRDDEPASVLVIKTEAGWRLRDVTLATGAG